MIGHKLLMIPGPIEFEQEVMEVMARPSPSHVSADFVDCFGEALELMRDVWLSPDGQPFVIAGSGTLAMDTAVANLVEPGDRALVVNTGYFSDRMAAILERYGCRVDQVNAALGDRPSTDDVAAALGAADYKIMTVTHVDTSTGVLADAPTWCRLGKDAGALTVLDGVCSLAGEEMRQQSWGVDVALTASQKAIGVPPGLALLVVSPQAMDVFKKRKKPVANYYADWANWLPIMEAYEGRKPSYFGTPAVNLVMALRASLRQIVSEGMDARFRRHQIISRAVKDGVAALGLSQVPVRDEVAAHTMTTPYFPGGVDAALMGAIRDDGVIFAGGLHPKIKTEYFRIGHMGSCDRTEALASVSALESGLKKQGYAIEPAAGVTAAQKVLLADA